MEEERESQRTIPVIINFGLILASLTAGLVYYVWHFDLDPAFMLIAFVIPFAVLVGAVVWWRVGGKDESG
jgi:hypothetical protein